MSRWFRFYTEAMNDPKVQRLPGDLFKAWVNLLCVASQNDGQLPPLEDISFSLRMTDAAAGEVLEALTQQGLIDEFDGRFMPHNWDERQYKSDVSTERVQKFRKRQGNVSGTVSETPPEQIQKQIQNRTEKKDSEANASGADAPSDPSIAEREFFKRGREVLGKKAGGLLANLLRAKGKNVALARSALELAATKANPAEYVGGICRGPPVDSPTALKDHKQQEWENARQKLRQHAYGGDGSGESGGQVVRLLPAERG